MRLIGAVARLQGRLEYLVNDMTAWGLRGCRAVYWHMICPRGHKKRAHPTRLFLIVFPGQYRSADNSIPGTNIAAAANGQPGGGIEFQSTVILEPWPNIHLTR